VNLATYARRNMFRRKGRTILTMTAVALAVIIFCLIRTAVAGWNVGASEASKNRLATRHKVSFTMQLPRKYADEVRTVPGVQSASWANWFGAKDPLKRVPFFAGFAADVDSFFETVNEMQIDPKQLADWKSTKNGIVIGDVLAEKLDTAVGKDITLSSDIYPGDWKFKVVGIYTPLRKTVDRMSMILRWDFLNDDPRAQFSKDQIGWMWINITDPDKSGEISRAIDKHFEDKDDQTITMDERAFQLQWLGAFSAILNALDAVSLFILIIMMLILANTVAMSVRERTHEYGVLRAIGFSPKHVVMFILGESILIALVGALIGIALIALLVNMAMGPAIEKMMAGMFPAFHAGLPIMVAALVAAMIVGAIAGLVPAIRASRLRVTDALRRLD
jgi:putative ABC transport system permease protein